jgi:hypothetical protein
MDQDKSVLLSKITDSSEKGSANSMNMTIVPIDSSKKHFADIADNTVRKFIKIISGKRRLKLKN